MKVAQVLQERIRQEQVTTGAMATMHLWPGIIETLRLAGLDYLIIDLEHGAFSDDLVADVCSVGRMTDFPVLIRPIDAGYSTVRRAIDFGSCGLLAPAIETVEQLDSIRDAIWMPPRGKRRPGGLSNRWITDFNYSNWQTEVEANFIVLPQIETRQGLENVDAIAGHEVTTAIAIGPYDLSAELGVCWEPDNKLLTDAIAAVRQAGRKAGKNMWLIGAGPQLIAEGYAFVCIAEPMLAMQQTLSRMNEDTKQGRQSDQSTPSGPLP